MDRPADDLTSEEAAFLRVNFTNRFFNRNPPSDERSVAMVKDFERRGYLAADLSGSFMTDPGFLCYRVTKLGKEALARDKQR